MSAEGIIKAIDQQEFLERASEALQPVVYRVLQKPFSLDLLPETVAAALAA